MSELFRTQLEICVNFSVISLVLIGAYFQTIFITSNSASEIWRQIAHVIFLPNLTNVIKILYILKGYSVNEIKT